MTQSSSSQQSRRGMRRTLALAVLPTLVLSTTAIAQFGGMGGKGRGGRSDGGANAKCPESSADKPLPTPALIASYASERLASLPAELGLDPVSQQLFTNYARALTQLMDDDVRRAARQTLRSSSALHALGEQIDLANNRTAAWEVIQEAATRLYEKLTPAQKTIADRRLVVSLDPSAWIQPMGG